MRTTWILPALCLLITTPSLAQRPEPPPLKQTYGVLAPARAPAPTPLPAPPVPKGATFHFALLRDRVSLDEAIDVAARVGRIDDNEVQLETEKQGALRLQLTLPPALAVRFAPGDVLRVSEQTESTYGDLTRRLVVRRDKAVVVEVHTLHGQVPIEQALVDGAVKVRQVLRGGKTEGSGRNQRTLLAVEVAVTGQPVITVEPGATVDLKTPAGNYRLWVVGSLRVEPRDKGRTVEEGQPFQLTLVLSAPGPIKQ